MVIMSLLITTKYDSADLESREQRKYIYMKTLQLYSTSRQELMWAKLCLSH